MAPVAVLHGLTHSGSGMIGPAIMVPVVRVFAFTVVGAAFAAGAVLAYGAYLVARDERAARSA